MPSCLFLVFFTVDDLGATEVAGLKELPARVAEFCVQVCHADGQLVLGGPSAGT